MKNRQVEPGSGEVKHGDKVFGGEEAADPVAEDSVQMANNYSSTFAHVGEQGAQVFAGDGAQLPRATPPGKTDNTMSAWSR